MIHADWINGTKTPWEQKIMAKQAQRARMITIGGLMTTAVSCLIFVISPLFGFNVRLINNTTDTYEGHALPFQTYYPFDFAKSPIFEFLHATQIITMFFAIPAIIVPENFFGALVFHACGQCEILYRKTRDLLRNKNVAGLDYDRFRVQLGNIVDNHMKLIRFFLNLIFYYYSFLKVTIKIS